MITEGPVLDLLEVEILAPQGGFILGRSRLNEDDLGNGDTELQWTGYLGPATSGRFRRGAKRDGLTNTLQVGTLTITLLNAGNPEDESEITPNTPIRVRAKSTGAILYTGVILDIDMTDTLDKQRGTVNSHVTIQAVDAVQAHANTTRYGAISADGFERWEARISRLSSSSAVPINPPTVDDPIVRYAF
jgi:hypothetical protein